MMAAMVLALPACGGDSEPADESQALYAIGTEHQLCMPSAKHSSFTEGLDTMANRGPAPVTVDRVEWADTEGLTLLSVRVFQRSDEDRFATFGVWNGAPARGLKHPKNASEARALARSEPAEGAVLGLADPEQSYLNLVVSYRGTSGSAGPLRLHYTDADGRQGVVNTKVRVTVRPSCGDGPATAQ